MPELAEVALYARDISKHTKNSSITKITFPNQKNWGRIIIPPSKQKTLQNLLGRKIIFQSAGKVLLLFDIKHSTKPLLEIRLGMTGTFRLHNNIHKWKKHCFMILETNNVKIHYFDPRRFSRVVSPKVSEYAIGGYSVSKGFQFKKTIKAPKGFLKKPRITWLLTSGHQTGVGNYMANEALGRMNLSPFEPCKNELEAIRLLKKCADVANASINHGGNSFGTGYFQLNASEGKYARYCRYYQNPDIPKKTFKGRPVFS
ncbi:MAG: hypothetical protein H7235_04945, partial [Bdellovibrionaceae bacterium]|nr:hypothetical protein [Pseudobdellovibrionaceae bacterium]